MATVKKDRPRKLRGSRDPRIALKRYQREYENLKRELGRIGYICDGSIARYRVSCGRSYCGCRRDPKRRHGPYTYWTRKVRGRTDSRNLPKSLVPLYREGIRNHRRLRRTIEKMRELSLLAFDAAKSETKG
jgi:hypothetical protein